MIAGHGTPDQAPARLFAYRDPEAFAELIDRLVEASIEYLVGQLEAGVDAVQIFDTWAGVLPPEQFERWCIEPTQRIVEGVREQVSGCKDHRLSARRRRNGAALCGNDRRRARLGSTGRSSDRFARDTLQSRVPVQGNLDPLALLAGGAALDREVDDVLTALAMDRSSSISATASCRRRRSRMSSGCSSACADDTLCTSGSKPSTSSRSSPGWPACSICRGCSSITATAKPGSEQSETFKVMERRLLNVIMKPAMIVTWVVGLCLLLEGQWLGAGWLHAKLAAGGRDDGPARTICALGARISLDRNRHPQKFYRIINEVPTVLMIVIVMLVVVKPF